MLIDGAEHQLVAFAINVFRLCVWLALLAAIFVPLERLFALRPRTTPRASLISDLSYYFLSSLAPGVLLGAPMAALAWAAHSVIPGEVAATVAAWPLWLRIVASLIVGEIGFYWGHRWSHQIPLLWRFHRVHHGAEHIDWLVNTRAHPVDMVFTRLCGLVPLYAVGLAAPVGPRAGLIPVLVLLTGTVWGFFIHANVRWRFGPLERLIATPHFHHWHHTREDHVDRNFASMLPWFDWMFGTLHLPPRQWPRDYGLAAPLPPSLADQLLGPFAARAEPGFPLREPPIGEGNLT